MSGERADLIRDRLEVALPVAHMEIADESHRHKGHAEAQAGGSHFRLLIVSSTFADCGRIQRHRLVYDALGDAMRRDVIHALSIRALTPDEYEDQTA